MHRQVRVKGCVWLTLLLAKDRLGVRTHRVPHWPFLSHVTQCLHPHWAPATIGHDDTGLGFYVERDSIFRSEVIEVHFPPFSSGCLCTGTPWA